MSAVNALGKTNASSASTRLVATAAVGVPVVVSLESVNTKVNKLWIIYANPRAPALDRRVYTDLFIQFGQALCRHIEDNQPLFTPLFSKCKNYFILLVQNRPELIKIAEVGCEVIDSLANVSKKLPNNSSARKQALNTHLQQMVMNLFLAKEMLLMLHIEVNLKIETSRLQAEREKLYLVTPHALPNKKNLDITPLLIQRAEVSLEALVIFCKYISFNLVSYGGLVEKLSELVHLTPSMIEELNGFSRHSHPHVREVASTLLMLDKSNKIAKTCNEVVKKVSSFSNSTGAITRMPLIPHLQPFIPELIMTRNSLVETIEREEQEAKSTPHTQDQDGVAFSKYYETYKSAAAERYFAYQIFYKMLHNQQKTSGLPEDQFRRCYLLNHAFSLCHRGSNLPTPEEFAELSYGREVVSSVAEGSVAPTTASTATAAAPADYKSSKDDKALEEGKIKGAQKEKSLAKEDIPTPYKQDVKPEKKKPQKKDPFAYLAKEGATAAAVAPQSDEPPKTSKFGSAGAPAVAVATDVATQTALEAVFTGCSVDLKAIQYAPRVDAAIKATTDWNHGFTTALDKFLGTPSYSMQSTWENPTTGQNDTLHCFVVEAENAQGQKTRHVATYAVDSRNVCYHRCLQHKSHEDLIDQIMKNQIRDKLDYPSLRESAMAASGKLKMVTGKIDDSEMSLDQAFGIVSVKDTRHKMIFRVIPKPGK
jgi:hypothetical protein